MAKISNSKTRWTFGLIIGFFGLIGTAPAFLNFFIDPFEMFGSTLESKKLSNFVEKTHYPLWKLTHYPRSTTTVVLGDSRARALRNKYWQETGGEHTYNFAYGGGTIPELYSTFKFVTKNPNVNTLVVGIQLRSFDEKHKKGMNRVPEAIKVGSNPIEYLKNWFVTKTSWQILKLRNPELFKQIDLRPPALISEAAASEIQPPAIRSVEELLRPEVCFGCELPEGGDIVEPVFARKAYLNLGLGRGRTSWDRFTNFAITERVLPKKFARQIKKNARADWKAFTFSERYWEMIEEIGRWSKAKPGRRVLFIIPPTIAEMQNTISRYGLQELNDDLRRRLARLGPVLDFDYANPMTARIGNFSDAYHFNSKYARKIVREAMMQLDPQIQRSKKYNKHRSELKCPDSSGNMVRKTNVKKWEMIEGTACRLWKGKAHAE